MRQGRRTAGLVTALFCIALLAACGDREPQVRIETQEPDRIFRLAEAELEAGRAARAAEWFGEIERLYPYSDWARRGLIMSAAAYHQARDYENSRAAAQRFLDFYPADEDAAYAQYLLALSYYDQIDKVGRDQGLTFQALRGMREVVARYPDSDYARSALMKFELAFDQLAAKEMEVGRYYLRRDHFTAAINRFRVVVEDYQTSTQTPEALHRLVEAYLSLGLEDEAQTAAAILGHNFQASEWYEDSFRLLTRRGLEPRSRGEGWLQAIYRQTIRGQWL